MKLHFGKSLLFAGLAFLCTSATSTALAQDSAACKLVIHVDGFHSDKGKLGATIFKSPDGWPEKTEDAFRHGPFPITGTSGVATFDLPAGDYGVAVIDDINGNKKLDRNFLGIPTEGFGFANNPKVNLSAPPYSAAVVHVACPVTETTIHLIYK